jgi:hypothetical protein
LVRAYAQIEKDSGEGSRQVRGTKRFIESRLDESHSRPERSQSHLRRLQSIRVTVHGDDVAAHALLQQDRGVPSPSDCTIYIKAVVGRS